ncbi:PREDICTED: probable LRR receptor-like serine/threonine-protein kinase At1g51880-like [Fragaria vesca subsp. vesca]
MTWILTFISIMGVSPLLLTILITLSFFLSETESTSFEIVNNCNYTVWPAVISSGTVNLSSLSTTGFTLKSGASFNLSVPNSWQGRVWGRTLCNESSTGNFSCFTADCGTGKVECGGNGSKPPATFAEFLINSTGMDIYDVTLVDGFNLPMVVEPLGGSNCKSSGCSADLNGACPKELRVAREGSQGTVACMTPCTAFNNDLFCCTGQYNTPETCAGTVYTDYFKQRCPKAYTYSYDDNQTTYTCVSANYSIVFCPISLDQTPAETPAAKEPTVPEQVPSKSKRHKIIIASVASSAGIIIFILAVLAGLWSTKRKKRQQEIQNSSLELDDGRRFMYSELVKITNNFASPIGAGGFGKVYHGILENDMQVAVKLLISASGSSEFQNEVKLLMRAHHRNVVSFTGYCYDGKTMALVFEYVANGNLQQHLTASDVDTGNILTWKERLQIAVDAAQGLDYLHNGCKPPIIHRDIKTSNILLTEKMQAKICDFGVSKLLSTETATHTMTDHVRGTRGYFDPEYYTTGKLNKKSDIYSFGIVLLELITGRTAIIEDVEPEPVHICQWVRPMFQRRDIESILDSRIQAGTYNVSSAWKAVEIAMECVSSTAFERPDINVVYKELKECFEIEVPPEIAKVPEVDEESDDCSTNSSVSFHMASHAESESFLVHMKSHIESETERHTC